MFHDNVNPNDKAVTQLYVNMCRGSPVSAHTPAVTVRGKMIKSRGDKKDVDPQI